MYVIVEEYSPIIKYLENEIRKEEKRLYRFPFFIKYRDSKLKFLEKLLYEKYISLEKLIDKESK